MKKFLINVNGNSYEVEVEEINGNASPAVVSSPTVALQFQKWHQHQKAAPAPKQHLRQSHTSSGGGTVAPQCRAQSYL